MPVETVFRIPVQKKPAPPNPETKWRTISQEKIYGRRLLEALKNSSQPSNVARYLAIKEAADTALALTAKGQTRWSRAILSRRWRKRKLWVKAGGKIRRSTSRRRLGRSAQTPPSTKGGKVTDGLRVLSGLVPGGRKLSAPTLLEETADYVAALEVQVKTMRTLAELLSAVSLAVDGES